MSNNTWLRIRHEAMELAISRLKAKGITDPILRGDHTYEDLQEYRTTLGALYPVCIKELTEDKRKAANMPIKQTWADAAYS